MMLSPDMMAVLKKHQKSYPVKVGTLARDLGIEVKETDLPDNVSGTLTREDTDKWVIRVNRRHSKTRQRFTVAHEVAHFLLHRNQIGNGLTDDTFYRSDLSDTREREANRLAADILMPWPLVRLATEGGVHSVEELAEAFDVSSAAMHIRLGLPT
ncbi:ImmA/IrrE family metallo-endopeptidase (plasmid) [Azospirillum humicireducens]|uniref:ImmA/IrrE family metallo-endopeptidase n=1 Tax=Azospirillum humicireducens TaxID=1226968 RepID=A0A2R4VQI2_9PROT|nr:ImmA/IrrE family metallo-endopeptidase [Azospirillum humicireducens]AWB06681.1 ImmA/IrrE family metallo-endopeptidase [Azospirillum humicireducens]